MEFSAGFATADPKSANPARNPRPGAESSDSTPKAFTGARSAPVERGPRPRPMLSVLNLMILRLDVDSVEVSADLGSAGANPYDYSMNFLMQTTSP